MKKRNHWFNYERLHHHASDTPAVDSDDRQLYYVWFNEPVVTTGKRKYAKEFTARLNEEFQASFDKICEELVAKYPQSAVVK